MALFRGADHRVAHAVSELVYCNPFLPRRIELEREALAGLFDERHAQWNVQCKAERDQPNVASLVQVAQQILEFARSRLAAGAVYEADDLELYEHLLLFVLFDRWQQKGFRSESAPAAA